MYFLCDDLLHLYTSQRVVSDDLCLHLRAAPVHLRNLLAGSCRTYVLESILLDIPIYVWYQRVCKNQQHGRNSSGSVSRISGTLDTSYRIFLHNLHRLPATNHIEPPTCHGTPAYVQATKTGCQDIQITKLYSYYPAS